MTPEQFLAHLQRTQPAPACLFLGAEPYRRERCRKALVERMLPAGEREEGLVRYDLDETSLDDVLDGARSLSLFVSRRVIWVINAEAALPRGRSSAASEEKGSKSGAQEAFADYLQNPTPDVVLVLDASRYELEGEDKQKVERVRKFYESVPTVVEFPRLNAQEARQLVRDLARESGLTMERAEIDLLVESAGGDAMRISSEIEKLRAYTGGSGKIGPEDLAALVSDSSASTVFVLVDALARGDRMRALDLLQKLVRQGEYLPLALSFLGSIFRLALVAKESGLRTPQQVQQRLSGAGRPIWRSRAEQILQTASLFSAEQIASVLKKIFEADKALRDARPDDRIVLEEFILRLAD